ncbi:MAG: 4'-phosphopantetheinyl transferase superfamily protein [Pirellulales bacterium]|nr:4'-phosphopantetheinyl transferase superfamily protein [Pirellulales bacterium]
MTFVGAVSAELGPDDVNLYYVETERADDPRLLTRCDRWLSSAEQAQRRRFVFDNDRRLYWISHVLVRAVLASYLRCDPAEIEFAANRFGRPEVFGPAAWPRLRFNLSHTRGLACCAVSWSRDVGVDVEDANRREVGPDVAEHFFSTAEVAELRGHADQEQQRQFFRYWTLKEAYIKARGMGLSLPLDQFSFSLASDSWGATIAFSPALADNPSCWQFWQAMVNSRYMIAAAARCPPGQDLRFRLSRWEPAT